MPDRSFTITAREVERGVRITAVATPDVWPSLFSRLLIAGTDICSVPFEEQGLMSATFVFPAPPGPVVPEGYELDAFMRKLFVGLKP